MLQEFRIIWNDMDKGFYGTGDDIDITMLAEDLEYMVNYAKELKLSGNVYPATADDFKIKKWAKAKSRFNNIPPDKLCPVCGQFQKSMGITVDGEYKVVCALCWDAIWMRQRREEDMLHASVNSGC